MSSTKYITSMGTLKRKDNSICFRKDDKNVYIPVKNTKEIYCLDEISINTKLLDFLSQNKIIVHFFNYNGSYSGTFYPKDRYMSGRLLIQQIKAHNERRIEVSKSIVLGLSKNICEVLYHYYKHNKKEVKETIDWTRNVLPLNLKNANDVSQIMQVEGEVWQRFYGNFKYILLDDFIMSKRVKRPPDNPINTLISWGNTLLYTKTITAIYHTHLDQRISFLHSPAERRFSLSLDISEVFKPIVVFKTIFDLVNNRKIQVKKHFKRELNYCILNEEGKKIFISAFEKRLDSVFAHPKLKRKTSFNNAIKLDCYKLIKFILEGKEFIPFNIKEKF